jgi:hypothetical protein
MTLRKAAIRPIRLPLSEDFRQTNPGKPRKEDPMCPECVANAALVAGSVISTGGIGALVAKVVRSKKSGQNDNPKANDGKEK